MRRRRASGMGCASTDSIMKVPSEPGVKRRANGPGDGHGRNAGTWNVRGGSAAKRFDYLYSEDELREWVPPLRELSNQAEEAYAFFNNNNQTNGVAQAPAGAQLLRKLLDEESVPVA